MDYEDPRSIAQEHAQLYWQMVGKNSSLLSGKGELEDLLDERNKYQFIQHIHQFQMPMNPSLFWRQ